MYDADRTDGRQVARADRVALALLVAGDAHRTDRGRSHLRQVMLDNGLPSSVVQEIDVLREPLVAIRFRGFATPALVSVRDEQATAVLYGDLSDRVAVRRCISDLAA